MTVKELIEFLKSFYNPYDIIATSMWVVEDVLEVAPNLTKSQAERVLTMVERNHDPDVGINWEVIKTAVMLARV